MNQINSCFPNPSSMLGIGRVDGNKGAEQMANTGFGVGRDRQKSRESKALNNWRTERRVCVTPLVVNTVDG